MLKKLWHYKYRAWARKYLHYRCELAEQSALGPVLQFAERLRKYAYGILNHCQYPIDTGRLEGINNKIKLIKRNAYGFNDLEYFTLCAKEAFPGSN